MNELELINIEMEKNGNDVHLAITEVSNKTGVSEVELLSIYDR